MQDKPTIVALVSMFFGAKLQGLSEHLGYAYKGAIGTAGLLSRIDEFAPVAILIDLEKEDLELQELVAAIKEKTNAPIIAFCGHVDSVKLEEARACTCDLVTTNGAIICSFETVINNALGSHA